LFGRRAGTKPRHTRPRVKLSVEVLEDRTLLSTIHWTGEGGDFLGDNPLNWRDTLTGEHRLPYFPDDVLIDDGDPYQVTTVYWNNPQTIVSVNTLTSQESINLSNTFSVAAGGQIAAALTVNASATVALNGSGILRLTGGGTFAGAVHAAVDGAIIELTNDQHTSSGTTYVGQGASFTGDGLVRLVGNFGAVVTLFLAPLPGHEQASDFELAAGGLIDGGEDWLQTSKTLKWTGGEMRGTGRTVIAAGAALQVEPGAAKTLDQRRLVNEGTATLKDIITVKNGAVIENAAGATFELTRQVPFLPASLLWGGGAVVRFENAGTLRANSDLIPRIEMEVTNTGTIQVVAGVLDLAASVKQNVQTATMQVSQGSTLLAWKVELSNGSVAGRGTLEFYGTMQKPGSFAWGGGTVQTSLYIGNFVNWTWTQGTLENNNWRPLVTVDDFATVNLSPLNEVHVRNAVVHNYGAINWFVGLVNLRDTDWLNYGTIRIGDVGLLAEPGGVVASWLQNVGVFTKDMGVGEAIVTTEFHNQVDANGVAGLVEVHTGWLWLNGNGRHQSTFKIGPNAGLGFAGVLPPPAVPPLFPATHTFELGTSFEGTFLGAGLVKGDRRAVLLIPQNTSVFAENFELDGASALSGPGTFSARRFEWKWGVMGTLGGTTLVNAGDELIISGADEKRIGQHHILNYGTVTWNDGDIVVADGITPTTIINDGTFGGGKFDIRTDRGIRHADPTAVNSKIVVQRKGILQKSFSPGNQESEIQPLIQIDQNPNSKVDTKGLKLRVRKVENLGGVIELNGGTLTVEESFEQSGGTTLLQGGILTVTGPVTVTGGAVVLGGGTLSATGGFELRTDAVLTGAGAIFGDVFNAGRIDVGGAGAIGVLTITGGLANHTQYGTGTVNIEIGGSAPGSGYDQLQINGTADLGGTLNVSLLNGYQPPPDQDFDIVTFWSLVEAFDLINGLDLGGGLLFDPIYYPDRLTLRTRQG
jgi:hypothetical protein